MRSRPLAAAITVITACTAFTVASASIARASDVTPCYRKVVLETDLSPARVRELTESSFLGVPVFPGSSPDVQMAACSPGSFATLGYSVATSAGTVSGIALYYERAMARLGWRQVYVHGVTKAEYRESGAATLTFSKGSKVISLDISRTNRHRVDYSMVAYSPGVYGI